MTEKYLPPLKSELRTLGYLRRYVSYGATDAIIANLTAPTNKLAYIAIDYYNQYNTIVNVVRHPIGVFAYGINNLNQFGDSLENVVYQSALILYRRLIMHYNLKYPNNRYTKAIPNKLIQSLADTIYQHCYIDASIIATEIRHKTNPPDVSNGWYAKLLAKKNIDNTDVSV